MVSDGLTGRGVGDRARVEPAGSPVAAPAAELRQVTKVYGEGSGAVVAVDGVSLAFDPGTFVALVGPSGSGKSSLLHLLGALDQPTEGEVHIGGRAVQGLSDDQLSTLRGRTIGFVFQGFHLLPALTAWQNVAVPLQLAGRRFSALEKQATDLLDRFGLAARANHRPGELSGGEQQRVAIARAMIVDPAVLVADEPTGNLDSASGEVLVADLARCAEAGALVVMATHDERAARAADRVVTLVDGRVVAEQ